MTLDTAVEHLLGAKRITAATQSYAKDNPIESRGVFEYLNGGGRPIGVLTEMGLGLLDVEDARRGVDPEPPHRQAAWSGLLRSSRIRPRSDSPMPPRA